MKFPSRPLRTEELVERVKLSSIKPEEKDALQALCRGMIGAFKDKPKPSYILEAAAISPILKGNDYSDLVTALSNAIINGTADGNIADPELLGAFAHVLWHAKGVVSVESNHLGSVLGSLLKRSKGAGERAELEMQYHLVCCLSAILDAMMEVNLSGLSREGLHKPLGEELKELPLLGVPDDETPYQALWRYTRQAIKITSALGSAMTTWDLDGVFDSLPDPGAIFDGMKKLIELGKEIEIEKLFEGIAALSKQRRWYTTIRYMDLLIQSEAFGMLENLTKEVLPLFQDKKEFLCQLFAQIEWAWTFASKDGSPPNVEKVNKLFRWVLKNAKLKDLRV
ncbi:hypothetical protein MMC25_005080 [Agyrium rufum]|nr:hypothetical protein [Agyrium rufum]